MTATDARAAALAALAGTGPAVSDLDLTGGPVPTGVEYEDGHGRNERIVLADHYSFKDKDGSHYLAVRGDTVYLGKEAADRGDDLGVLAKPADLEDPVTPADLFTAPPPPVPAIPGATGYDATAPVADALAYINAAPSTETAAIRDLENARAGGPRKTVTEALDAIEAEAENDGG